jgi:hypothetical protein
MEMQNLPMEDEDITDPQSLADCYERYLNQVDAVILIANEYCGTWPRDEEGGFISLQIRKARERARRCYVWLNVKKPEDILKVSYREYLQKLPDEVARTGGKICVDNRDMAAFASLIKAELDLINPAEIPRPAIICSNMSSKSKEYQQFQEIVLDAIAELNRYSVIPSVEAASGQISLTALAEQVNSSDIIVVICFDQEWPWAISVAAQLKQVCAVDKTNRARILVVGPHFSPDKGLVDMRTFRFKTFNELDLDKESFKEALKRAIQQSVAGLKPSAG